jgi:hypothetical protein
MSSNHIWIPIFVPVLSVKANGDRKQRCHQMMNRPPSSNIKEKSLSITCPFEGTVYLFVLYAKVNADKRERVDLKSTPPSFRTPGLARGADQG